MLDPAILAPERQRRLKRSEFLELEKLGAFEDERVELLYGVLVEMTSGLPPRASAIQELNQLLVPKLVGRATVRIQTSWNEGRTQRGEYVQYERAMTMFVVAPPIPHVAVVGSGQTTARHGTPQRTAASRCAR